MNLNGPYQQLYKVEFSTHMRFYKELAHILKQIPRDDTTEFVHNKYMFELWYELKQEHGYRSATGDAVNALIKNGIPYVFIERHEFLHDVEECKAPQTWISHYCSNAHYDAAYEDFTSSLDIVDMVDQLDDLKNRPYK